MQFEQAAELVEGLGKFAGTVRARDDLFGLHGLEVGAPVFDHAV